MEGEQYTFKGITGQSINIKAVSSLKTRFPAKHAEATERIDDALLVVKSGFKLSRIAIGNPDTSGISITLSPLETGTVTDADGNVYRTVKIGNQEWMAENLRTTKYNDGTSIPLVTDSAAWVNLTTAGYCFYNNCVNPDTNKKWGALYNWYTINTGKLAPSGWHVPSDSEWNFLQNYLISNGYNYEGTTTENYNAIAMAATTDWVTFDTIGAPGRDQSKNNSSGFSALPAGHRSEDGTFEGKGYNAHWWCTTESEYDSTLAYDHEVYFYFWYLGRLQFSKNFGSSVRLVRDN